MTSRRPVLTPGSVCWVDVASRDPDGSRRFYGALFGWEFHVNPDPATGHYTMAVLDGREVAGLAGLPTPDDASVSWTLYLTSANIGWAATMVTDGGGRVLHGPTAVPGHGSMMVAADPTGAVVGFWQPRPEWEFRTGDPGTLCWVELSTPRGAAADDFYATLYGYHQRQIGDGHSFDYTTWTLGEQTLLGRTQTEPGVRPHWMPYFSVAPRRGTDGAAERTEALGGSVLVEPFDSDFGRIAVVADPSGAVFSLVDRTRVVVAEPNRAEVDDPYDD